MVVVVVTVHATAARTLRAHKPLQDKGLIMIEPSRYRFFVHRAQPQYRLVLRDGSAFPDGTSESEWRPTRIREARDVNADVREAIAADGYCLFAIGLKLDVIRRAQP